MAVQHLPPNEQQLLQSLRDELPALRARVQALRSQGWTLAAIGAPLEAGRSTVRSWESHPDAHHAPSDPLPAPPNLRPLPSRALHSSTAPHPTVRALRPDVPLDDQANIANLAPLARRVRGGTPPDSPFRRAKRDLDALLVRYYTRGVPVQRLADLASVSYRAMKIRLDSALERSTAPVRTAAGL